MTQCHRLFLLSLIFQLRLMNCLRIQKTCLPNFSKLPCIVANNGVERFGGTIFAGTIFIIFAEPWI